MARLDDLNAPFGFDATASHLLDSERASIIRASRQALDESNHPDVPLLVGTGGGSAKHTIKLAKEAKEAGADYSIVICPGYFAFAMGGNKGAVRDFFWEVLEGSELPVMIYNFP
jgi:dihydrodipicolinate synthase/N-acetylneuraminate lyase